MSTSSKQRWYEQRASGARCNEETLAVVTATPSDVVARCSGDAPEIGVKMRITPTVAAAWLERHRNPLNRTSSRIRVERYARDMRAGNWHSNHQGVAFDPRGVLSDGEHRLRALVLADVTLVIWVHFNADPRGIDRGRGRSVLDERRMRGEKTSRVYIAAVKALDAICADDWVRQYTDDEVDEIETDYAPAADWLRLNIPAKAKWPAPVYAAFAFVHDVLPVEADALFAQVNLRSTPGAAALGFLRQIETINTAGSQNQRRVGLLALHALRNFVLGVDGSFLRPSDETMRWWHLRVSKQGAA